MRITKHEAAVLSYALYEQKHEIVQNMHVDREAKKIAISKLDALEKRLSDYETDNRLQSKSGRAYQYPSLTKIILNKLK